jgi:crotonobetainyl-CoA:carnitine CoA-transferase CaiB-like acyl-CoA transferase
VKPAPLTGVRVLEIGEALAGPFTCTLLADFGATVVKVERPGTGDSMRHMGPEINEVGLWWTVTGRGKRSIVVDLKNDAGPGLVRRLAVEWADVVVENFRPGVLDRLQLGWDQLHLADPELIMVRVSGFGQFGPYAHERGFGKIAEGFSGATNLTGHGTEPPVQPGYSLGDATTGTFAALGVLLALRTREQGSGGQLIDLALYESLFRLIEWQIPLAAHSDVRVVRNGNAFPFEEAFITDICQCKDGSAMVVSAATAVVIDRLRTFLSDHGSVAEALGTDSGMLEELRAYALSVPGSEGIDALREAGLVAGLVWTAEQLLENDHIWERENIIRHNHPDIGEILMPGIVPRLSETPGAVTRPAPGVGEHNEEVLSECLGLDHNEVEALLRAGVIAGGERTPS